MASCPFHPFLGEKFDGECICCNYDDGVPFPQILFEVRSRTIEPEVRVEHPLIHEYPIAGSSSGMAIIPLARYMHIVGNSWSPQPGFDKFVVLFIDTDIHEFLHLFLYREGVEDTDCPLIRQIFDPKSTRHHWGIITLLEEMEKL